MSKSLSSSSSLLHRALVPFSEKLKAAPHRDATHIAYGEWFRLYVDLLRDLPRDSSVGATEAKRSDLPSSHGLLLAQAKQAMDAALWSSLLAERWNQVLLPDSVSLPVATESSAAPSVWYAGRRGGDEKKESQLFSNIVLSSSVSLEGKDTAPSNDVGGSDEYLSEAPPRKLSIGNSVELLSPSFLAEPLSGGTALAEWMGELRHIASASAAVEKTRRHGPMEDPTPIPTFHICLPFSTLFQLKHEAHLRLAGSGPSAPAASATPLSLQERRARQTLLQSLHQLLQLQDEARRASSSSAPFLLQFHPWSATAEFDKLCELPRVRPLLSGPGPLLKSDEKALSLAVLCEAVPARLAYFTRHVMLQSAASTRRQVRFEGKNGKESHGNIRSDSCKDADAFSREPQPTPIALLTHSSELRIYRALGVPHVRERSSFKTWRQQLMLLADTTFSTEGATTGTFGAVKRSSSAVAHQRAWRGCGDVIRRMTAREENIRQSFSQH